jgi:hypothetical protein
MAVADKIIALLDTMTPASLDSLSPVRRRQFADLCRHWGDIAVRPAVPAMKAGAPESIDAPGGAYLGGVSIESVSAKPPSRGC